MDHSNKIQKIRNQSGAFSDVNYQDQLEHSDLSNNESEEQLRIYVKSQAAQTKMKQYLKAAASLTFFTVLFQVFAVFLFLIEDDFIGFSIASALFSIIILISAVCCWVKFVQHKKKLKYYTDQQRQYEEVTGF